MLSGAVDVLGPDRIMFGADCPYGAPTAGDGRADRGLGGVDSRGALGGKGGACAFVDHPLSTNGAGTSLATSTPNASCASLGPSPTERQTHA